MFPISGEKKKWVPATFLPILDYGDVAYQYASSYLLSSLDALYHGALRFITDCTFLTIILNYMKELHGLPWEFGEKCTYWVFCQIISDVLYKGICLEIINYVLNQIVISVCPLSELSLVKPLKYAAASDWNLLQK